MKYPELVSEEKHIDNLCYLRELTKLKIDDYVELKAGGHMVNDDVVIDYLDELEVIDNCLTNVYSKVKFFEDKQ